MQVEVIVQDHTRVVSELESLSKSHHVLEPETAFVPVSQDWEGWFQAWIEALQPSISPIDAYELCLRLTTDNEIQALNSHYRQQNQATDVLAFAALEVDTPQFEEHFSQPVYLGDIVISINTANRQAKAHQHSLERELAWLAAHGLLHLLGWDHPEEESLITMLNQQAVLLGKIGFL